MQNRKPGPITRILLIAAGIILFAGLIIYSALNVQHPVGADTMSEFVVTKLSLTHSIERDKDGKLVTPDTGSDANKACPT